MLIWPFLCHVAYHHYYINVQYLCACFYYRIHVTSIISPKCCMKAVTSLQNFGCSINTANVKEGFVCSLLSVVFCSILFIFLTHSGEITVPTVFTKQTIHCFLSKCFKIPPRCSDQIFKLALFENQPQDMFMYKQSGAVLTCILCEFTWGASRIKLNSVWKKKKSENTELQLGNFERIKRGPLFSSLNHDLNISSDHN